jgi:hypothetical protein
LGFGFGLVFLVIVVLDIRSGTAGLWITTHYDRRRNPGWFWFVVVMHGVLAMVAFSMAAMAVLCPGPMCALG